MKKRVCVLFLALALLLGGLPRARAVELDIPAPSAILMDAATGQILYEKNAHERLRPASVTKVMTLLLVMEALERGQLSWDAPVTASAAAAGKGGSQVYLEEGEQMSMDEMLKAVVVSSANDCATALAEAVAGSEAVFAAQMNERAAALGLQDTHFVNCTGLDDEPEAEEHLTSAHDIAVMSRELLKHDEIRRYTTIWMDTVRGGKFGLSNTNKLVRFYDGTTGLKTGFTQAAGHCLSASASRDGMELIAVVLHCNSSSDRFESAKALLDYGFAAYALVTPAVPEELGSVEVRLGRETEITPVLERPEPVLMEKSRKNDVAAEVELEPFVTAPVEKGQRLGTLTVRAGGEAVATIPIVAPERVERLTWAQVTGRILRGICLGG
ncbi:MAG: D-alanyl-D-alanine carboxypeptidase [Oscillospiraceae bacterium]|nr:D-alanyl-D-alanine carboxypeptidase [Oscillospiraceae bacterium]